MHLSWITAFAQALFNIVQNPVRSIFMAATLGAGAAAACLSTAILDGFGAEVERMAFGAYARSIVISENRVFQDRFGAARLSDLEKLTTALGEGLEGSAVWRQSRAVAARGAEQIELDIYGVRGDYRFEADMALASGRFLTDEDLQGAGRICMLGAAAATRLFGSDTQLIESSIRLNGVNCQVVGVFQPADTRTAERFTNAVLVPFDAAGRYFETTARLSPIEVDQMTLVFHDREAARLARPQVDHILRRAHGAPLSQNAPFSFADPAAPTRAVVRQRTLLESLLWSVAAVTLIGAAIGYAGFTSTTVDMRRRDIALQISAGATRGDILIQYWLESMIIGGAGGAMGLLVGFLAAQALGQLADIPISIQPGFALVALLSGAGAGAVAGLWPARRAASAPPALAVRR